MMRNPSTSLRVRRVADAISLACQAPSRPLSTSRSSAARKGSDIASLAIASGKARTPPQARWQGLGLFASGGRTRGWPTLKSCRMNLLPEISVARLALLSRSRRQGPSRHDRQWRQLPFAELAHRRCECEKSSPSAPDPIRREPTERPNASCRPRCGMGEAGPRFRPAKPVGMAGGGLRQTLQTFGRFASVHIGSPSVRAATVESQQIQQIQLLSGRTLWTASRSVKLGRKSREPHQN
jgi:hypothetical protein